MSAFVHPSYFHVFCRVPGGRWGRLGSSESINASDRASGLSPNQAQWDLVELYGISTEKVVVELFRINGGRLGTTWRTCEIVLIGTVARIWTTCGQN